MPEKATIHGFEVTRAVGLSDEQRENNRKWVRQLRYGQYKQTTNKLRGAMGYCCLGVAECAMGAQWQGGYAVREGESCELKLTDATRLDLGLPYNNGFVVHSVRHDLDSGLDKLNDVYRLKLPEIADIIAYWAGLEDAPAETAEKSEGAGA